MVTSMPATDGGHFSLFCALKTSRFRRGPDAVARWRMDAHMERDSRFLVVAKGLMSMEVRASDTGWD
jgi:hypothetical protein